NLRSADESGADPREAEAGGRGVRGSRQDLLPFRVLVLAADPPAERGYLGGPREAFGGLREIPQDPLPHARRISGSRQAPVGGRGVPPGADAERGGKTGADPDQTRPIARTVLGLAHLPKCGAGGGYEARGRRDP